MGWNILIDWTVTQVFHNSTHKISSGGIPAEVSCPYLECAYRCTQTHHEGVRGEGGVERKGERKDPSNVVFKSFLNHYWSCLNVFGYLILYNYNYSFSNIIKQSHHNKLHLHKTKKIWFTTWMRCGKSRKSCMVEEFQNKGFIWMTVFLNVNHCCRFSMVNHDTRDNKGFIMPKKRKYVWHTSGWTDV